MKKLEKGIRGGSGADYWQCNRSAVRFDNYLRVSYGWFGFRVVKKVKRSL